MQWPWDFEFEGGTWRAATDGYMLAAARRDDDAAPVERDPKVPPPPKVDGILAEIGTEMARMPLAELKQFVLKAEQSCKVCYGSRECPCDTCDATGESVRCPACVVRPVTICGVGIDAALLARALRTLDGQAIVRLGIDRDCGGGPPAKPEMPRYALKIFGDEFRVVCMGFLLDDAAGLPIELCGSFVVDGNG